MALLSCEDSTDGQTTTPSPIAITGTLRYTDINTNVGIAITRTPLWSGQTNVAQTVSYNIDPEVTAIKINSEDGTITVSTEATEANSGKYTISANGTGSYSGVITTEMNVTINPAGTSQIDGTFTYDDIVIFYGESNTYSPTWAGRTNAQQVLTYSIEPETAGITMNANGDIAIASTAASAEEKSYVVTASAGDGFSGEAITSNTFTITINSEDARISISGFTLSYRNNQVAGAYTRDNFGDIQWSTVPTATYTITKKDGSDAPSAIVMLDSGRIQIFARTLDIDQSGVYTVTATGNGVYKDSISTDVTINISAGQLTGLSYESIVTTVNAGPVSSAPIWSRTDQTVGETYNIGVADGYKNQIYIDPATGIVTVDATETFAENTYNVTVRGIGNYKDSTALARISITINAE